MGHEEISRRLSAYLDGEVSPNECAIIERHLAECGICIELLGSLRAVSALVRGTNVAPVDAVMLRRLHAQVDNLSKRSVERFGWALSAVAACVAIVAGIHLSMRSVESQSAAVTAPTEWEGAAVQLNNTNDEVASSGNNDLVMAQWMVADLSDVSHSHE